MSAPSLPSASGGVTRRLGVVGTMVWDTIHHRAGRTEPVEEWGGIGYALEALSVILPDGWEVAPIIYVGRDLSEEAFRFLREVPRLRIEPGVRVVPHANNRVELRYADKGRRTERLTGGVPPWRWPELAPLVRECDALYVNFISGMELELETAQSLRFGFSGPIYADLHSLFLGVGAHGDRFPRPLALWSEWLRAFDAVQVNEEEFKLLGLGVAGDPWELAARVLGPELKLLAVTLGERGAAYLTAPRFESDPFAWPGTRVRLAQPGPSLSGWVPVDADEVAEGDPTGCGDVWGATCFARLLAGDGLQEAMARANDAARRNVGHLGARGLRFHLRGRPATGEAP